MDSDKEELLSFINNMDLIIDNIKNSLSSSSEEIPPEVSSVVMKILQYQANKKPLTDEDDFASYKNRMAAIVKIFSDVAKLSNSFSASASVDLPFDNQLFNKISAISQKISDLPS